MTKPRAKPAPKTSGAIVPPPRRLRYFIYLRVSKADRKEGDPNASEADIIYNSIKQQRDVCEKYGNEQGWELAGVFTDDGRSGKDLERDDVQRMLKGVEAGDADVVVVAKLDRLSRSLREFVNLMHFFKMCKVDFVSVTQRFTTADIVGRMTMHVLMAFAEFEREMIVERTRDNIAGAKREGLWTGGLEPLGYDVVDGKLVPNEDEAQIVNAIFSWYDESKSTGTVLRKLAEHKYPPKARSHEDTRWSKDMVLRILRNALYIGFIPYQGQRHKGVHTAIVDRELFERVQTTLEDNRHDLSNHERDARYVLQSVLRCGYVTADGVVCDHTLSTASTRKRGQTYRYYRCTRQVKQGRDVCPSAPLPADAIEQLVLRHVRDAHANGRIAQPLLAGANQIAARYAPDAREACEMLPATIAKLSADSSRLVVAFIDAKGATRTALDASINDLGGRIARAQTELEIAQRRLGAVEHIERETKWVVDHLPDFGQSWETLAPVNRQTLVRSVIRTVRVDAESATVVFAPADPASYEALSYEAQTQVEVSLQIDLHRVRRKTVQLRDEPLPEYDTTRRRAGVAQLLALAHHIQRRIDSGLVQNRASIAAELNMTRARVTQVLDLTLLAPELQERVLALEAVDGKEPLTERKLREVLASDIWSEQVEIWNRVVEPILARTKPS